MVHLQQIQPSKKNVCSKAIIFRNKSNGTNDVATTQKGTTMKRLLTTLSVAALVTISLTGCTKTQEGAGIGAAVGALAGQAIGGDTGATLIGAGAGALIGGTIGNNQE